MPYTTGVATTAANLKDTIETFAALNGWTLSGGVLSKGSIYVTLTTFDSTLSYSGTNYDYRDIRISMSRSSSFSAPDVCAQTARTLVPLGSWPVTYWLFVNTNPDEIVCVFNYGGIYFQWVMFGKLVKQGTWTGGEWFAGARAEYVANGGILGPALTETITGSGLSSGVVQYQPCTPFWGSENKNQWDGSYISNRNSFLHCELEGHIWPGAGSSYGTGRGSYPLFPSHAHPLHSYAPNVWNDQAVMIPYWLWFESSDGYEINVGHKGHVRSIRMEYYNPGDIVTLGADQWKVFPWYMKSFAAMTSPGNANAWYGHSSLFGFAVRYVP